ncbi:MAG: tyrosine-type recombinase/integrase [Pirellulaceae bacterium]
MHRVDVLRMIKRRAQHAGLSSAVCCHTFRATGITAYLKNGGLPEHAQRIAAHDSVRTTKLYDRTADDISLDEIEKIQIQISSPPSVRLTSATPPLTCPETTTLG